LASDSARTAFVFAGGGSLGAVEVGMLHALVERGVRPDFAADAGAGDADAHARPVAHRAAA
jgi:NTE family protein